MVGHDRTDPTIPHARADDGGERADDPTGLDRRRLAASVAGGIVVGGLALAGAAPPAGASHNGGQFDRGWRWCTKCRALQLPKSAKRTGRCPAGGSHAVYEPYGYLAHRYFVLTDPNHMVGFRLCPKCRVFHLATSYGFGACAAKGLHAAPSDPTVYQVTMGLAPGGGLEYGWRQCTKCRALHWAGDGSFGPCAGGGTHDAGLGTDFLIRLDI